jgi:putative transposase
MLKLAKVLIQLFSDTLRLCGLTFRSSRSIKVENLFLRRQPALYVERSVKPRHIDPRTQVALALLSRFFNWRGALVVVRPETMMHWHRAGWKLFWRPSWRIVCRSSQTDPWRAASRIFSRAGQHVTELLRTTGK